MSETKKSDKNKKGVKVAKRGADVKIPADINIGKPDREPTAMENQRALDAMAGGTVGEPTIEQPTMEPRPTEQVSTESLTGRPPTDQIETFEDPNETNLEIPPEVQQTQKLAGIFGTEPKSVTEAVPHEDPSMAKKVLGWGTGWIPGVGKITSQPLISAYEQKGKRVQQDREVVQQFWKAMEEDPAYAKQLIRVDRFRDALQRTQGMSGEEILELDKNITEEGILSRSQFIQTMMKQGMEPEGGYKTAFGAIGAPKRPAKFTMKEGVIYDETTGEVQRDQNIERFNIMNSKVKKAIPDMSEEDTFLTTQALLSPGKPRIQSTVLAGGQGIYMMDRFSGKGRMIQTGLGGKSSQWNSELISTSGVPGMFDGMILYDKNAQTLDEAQKTSTILMFRDIIQPNGMTMAQEMEAIRKANADDTEKGKGSIMKMIQATWGYFSPADRNPVGLELPTPGRQQTRQRQPVETPPAAAPGPGPSTTGVAGKEEIGKVNKFFTSNSALGD